MIEVKAIGALSKYMDQGSQTFVPFTEGVTLLAVKKQVSLPLSEQMIVTINGQLVVGDPTLKDGDVILVMSPVSGG